MARRNNNNQSSSRRRRAAAAAFVLAALAASSSGAAAARVLRAEKTAAENAAAAPLPTVSSYGTYHGIGPDMGPTGDLMRGPGMTPGKGAGSPGAATNRGPAGSPPARGAFAFIQTSRAQAESRRDASGFEGIEPENVVSAHAGAVRMSRVQGDTYGKGYGTGSESTYTGTYHSNVVGGRMAAVAATQLGARAQSISGGRPINSRYGATPQTASIRMIGGFDLPKNFPTAVAGSGRVHVASFSGDGAKTGVIASTPLVQSIAKSG